VHHHDLFDFKIKYNDTYILIFFLCANINYFLSFLSSSSSRQILSNKKNFYFPNKIKLKDLSIEKKHEREKERDWKTGRFRIDNFYFFYLVFYFFLS